ncbi:MAG: c-type cytochrome [Herpetosiphon sp.]|nr:c-type cytochrome [Herpetosiphon sp.]
MRKLLKVVGWMVGVLAVLILVAGLGIYFISQSGINKTYAVNPAAVSIPTDPASIAEGERIATFRGCRDCHGANLAGKVFIDGGLGHVTGANLTSGKGGIGATFSDADWVRAIRHGIGADGKALWIMPSSEYNTLSDSDLGKIIAYIKQVPPVDTNYEQNTLTMLGRALYVFGQVPLLNAEKINHDAQRVDPSPAVTAEYGKYLASSCTGCHGQNYAGQKIPGSADTDPLAANLTPAGDLKSWTADQFITMMRTGKTPEGKQIDPQYMPWTAFGKMTDDELKALFMFLQSLPAVPSK